MWLSDASPGEDADLWWAVRGCAPAVGVVTSATFRTHEIGPVFVDRMVVGLDALATYFQVAPELPRDTTMGAVLGYTPLSPDEPVLFVYTACASTDDAIVARARAATSAVTAGSRPAPLHRSESSGRYLSGLPEFAIPGRDGAEPDPIRLPQPGDGLRRLQRRTAERFPRDRGRDRRGLRRQPGPAPGPAGPLRPRRSARRAAPLS
ncbi:hypothetical protein [Actinomycetospora sp.]|uniref:hypothetical protein n=1 Tax=Actinomycetospora sp. TaxID=1872135 RepID=UPI002F41AF14